MLASYTLVVALDFLVTKTGKPKLVAIAAAIVLSVLMPHHLLQGAYHAAHREHGDPNIENGRYFPDHASVGKYVKQHLQTGDIVVASDVLQQRWYVGQADFWLRNERM